jgi:FKBP-type peptidyl-prolyl cis-trans isomerase
MKILTLAVTMLALTGLAAAQAATAHKAAASGPAKVTGEPTKTASGLEYWDIKVGTGAIAETGQHVAVDYTVWLASGKKIDSSAGGPPYEFMLGAGQVIKGWDEGISGMKVGGRRQLHIPPDLAYGAAGRPSVPPNSALIFDVRLVSVK